MARRQQMHACGAEACAAQIPLSHFMCQYHWHQLPDAIRGEINEAFREFQQREPGAVRKLLNAQKQGRDFIKKEMP